MFCSCCGNTIDENQSFCSRCGASFGKGPVQSQLIGFSPRINDAAFTAYKKKSRSWSFIFSFILAVIAIVAFPIYGNATGEIDWPFSLYYGLGIGGMFIIIAILQTIKRGVDKTWDGVVADKYTYISYERNRNGYRIPHTVYVLKVKKDTGGSKKHKWRDSPGLYDYYNIGDRVRHHKGFYYYEKYDKSQDTQIMCAACMAFIDIGEETCTKCKCPLLK
ncbi:MAG: hypothetical protein A4E71_02608 [Smithella sp. PtaU1.Bin162]|nr:MAG: hypothetical protein A4E71_02608 [Smithella sp. PtaU1.Bin162]